MSLLLFYCGFRIWIEEMALKDNSITLSWFPLEDVEIKKLDEGILRQNYPEFSCGPAV